MKKWQETYIGDDEMNLEKDSGADGHSDEAEGGTGS
jgi:hypothetical protein